VFFHAGCPLVRGVWNDFDVLVSLWQAGAEVGSLGTSPGSRG